MFAEYGDRAAFYIVYIEEAHTTDLWQMPANEKQGVLIASPKNAAERDAAANACVRNLHIDIPALIDGFDNTTEQAYTAWPDRLYVIDKRGRVAYKSAPGPFGFRPGEAEAILRRM
ncbi:MAG: deiodinase-like protein [Bryobacteraceae bacterium]